MSGVTELSAQELEVYARQIVLDPIGYKGQKKIRRGRVCIIGLGGLGSVSASRLTGMGVGFLRIVDMDVISRSDIHRQTLYDVDSVGGVKVEVAAKKLCRINPHVEIDPVAEPLSPHNVDALLEDIDVVVDGLDRIEPRYILNRGCIRNGIPYVFGSAIEVYGNATSIIPKETVCLECFYGHMENSMLDKCAVVGVHPSIVAIIANIQVYDAVNILMDQTPRLLGKLFYADLNHMNFDLIDVKQNKRCLVCGSEAQEPPKPVTVRLIEETCARDGKRTFQIRPKKFFKVNLDNATSLIDDNKWKIISKSHFGVTFRLNPEVDASLLHTGVMVIQASPRADKITEKFIKEIYKELTGKNLS